MDVISSGAPVFDVSDRADIDRLVRRFYERALTDPTLAPVFEVLAIVGATVMRLVRQALRGR